MLPILNALTNALQSDERLVIDGKLAKNKIVELALNLDPSLLKLLLSDDQLKGHFFQDVDGMLIFDKVAFQRFVNNKSFLPDSFTQFKNKIGLSVDSHYLNESNDVVLSWPYKDCVLEGGQTKDDQKRNEVFWNETLAPEQVDTLLAPKALTNFKRYDVDGEHSEFTIGDADNLILKGNNLLALRSILPRYRGKVKLIYIDPPYNTHNDSFCYNDSFSHSTWLTFMKNRLLIAKELLAEDGSIYVQLDYNEIHYAKILLDEIFGRELFQAQIIWKRTYSRGDAQTYGASHDTILFYSKSESFTFNKTFTEYDEDYKKRFSHKDERGLFQDRNLSAKGLKGGGYNYVWKGKEGYWRCPETTMQKLDDDSRIYYTKNGTPRMKQYLHEMQGRAIQDIWDDINVINSQSTERVGYSTQKPEKLLKRIIESSSDAGDIVVDFFMGSGTTQAVAHKMNRQYVGIEQMVYVQDTTLPRLKSIISGDQNGISKDVNWQGGGSFVYCELAELASQYSDRVEQAQTSEELISIWDELKESSNLSYKVDPKQFDKNISSFNELSFENQQRFLIEAIDKNQLYVNYSDIDDESNGISEQDKKFNQMFYGA
ncbi:TPA: site-specific DNA-methyltransferase [Vibrio parahaemolyticus]|nr:site-specific DNA-methyltransferase [Vibrio parahaemolyticus]